MNVQTTPDEKMLPSRMVGVFMATVLGLASVPCASAATVYAQKPMVANTINSNAVLAPDGSDQDVVAYDNFRLVKAATIREVTWRGTAAGGGTSGFTIKVYSSRPNPAAGPNISAPLYVARIPGHAGETPAMNGMFDYRVALERPLVLAAHRQYWLSIVADKQDMSLWGWGSGSGGDGKSLQSYSEFKVLPAGGDRAFSFSDTTTQANVR